MTPAARQRAADRQRRRRARRKADLKVFNIEANERSECDAV